MPSRSRISAAVSMPSSDGRIAREWTRPLSRSIGPGRPMPAREDAAAVDAGLVEQLLDEPGGEVERLVARASSTSISAAALGEDGERQVGDGDAHVAVAEVDAERARRRTGRAR